MGGAAAGLGAAVVLAACFMSADHKRGLTCDEAAERGYICEPGAGVAGGGGSVSGTAGAPVMGAGGASGLGGGGAGGGGSGSGGSAGGGPVCTAPEVDCGGTCVDLTASDAANCGACGRSCLGTATCAAGACVPEAMATNEVAPYALVHDEASLYWVSPAVKTDVGFRSRVR
ncbi:MAG TPA: hypothetical protein VFS00_09485, partial [Polyangiaceae bacterium]|nr:hypothetical protein [Polyangiaceae bacterium]